MEENSVGRPPVIDENKLKQLEVFFSNGATDREACFLAGISQQTLYNYQKDHPEFIERKEALKDMIKYQAKVNIQHAIVNEKDIDKSQWYLERKGKDEGFNSRTELTGKDGEQLQAQPILVKFIDKNETPNNDNRDTNGIQEIV